MPAMFAISKVTASQPITSQSSPFGFGNLASHSALRSDTEALGRAPPSEPVARYNLRKETSLTSRFCSTASAVSNNSGSFDSTGTPSSPAAGLPSTMNRMAPCLVRSLTPNKYSDSLTRVRLRLRENTFLPQRSGAESENGPSPEKKNGANERGIDGKRSKESLLIVYVES